MAELPGYGYCYVCKERDGKINRKKLIFVTWFPVTPSEENDYRKKGADLCPKHDKEATKKYLEG